MFDPEARVSRFLESAGTRTVPRGQRASGSAPPSTPSVPTR